MKIPSILSLLFMLLPLPMDASEQDTATAIIALERTALERWNQGDPDGFIEISDPDVVYFDPFQERRLNGIDELKALYDGIRGMVQVDRYEMIDPKVQASESMAVLTYNLVSHSPQRTSRWNSTEVYQRSRWALEDHSNPLVTDQTQFCGKSLIPFVLPIRLFPER